MTDSCAHVDKVKDASEHRNKVKTIMSFPVPCVPLQPASFHGHHHILSFQHTLSVLGNCPLTALILDPLQSLPW